jgi:rhodanese-related sulfurtransferase
MDEMSAEVPQITPEQLRQLLESGEPLTLLDVREPFEWEISNLEKHGARMIPMAQIPARVEELDRAERFVVYCRTGARSELVVRYMLLNGFERVLNLDGGINGWARSEDPELRTY